MDRYDTLMAVAASPWDGVAWTLALLAAVTAVAALAAREAARHPRGAVVRTRRHRVVASLGIAAVALGGATWGWQDLVHRSRVADARAVVRDILAERGLGEAGAIDVLAGDGGVTAIAHVGRQGWADDALWVSALHPSADPTAVYPAGVDPERPLVVSMP